VRQPRCFIWQLISLDCSDAQGNVDLRALVDESLVAKAAAGAGAGASAGAAGDSKSGSGESKAPT
jgi:hypothetical protein